MDVSSFNLRLDWVLSVGITGDNKYIITASWNRSIKVFDFETKQLLHHYKDSHPGRKNA